MSTDAPQDNNQDSTARQVWLQARLELLAAEKAHLRAGDLLAAQRRALPWLKVDKPYLFDSPTGQKTLADLFGDRSQLIVQHFMLTPDQTAGCAFCSFWADGYNPMICHLNARDISFATVSRAHVAEIEAYRERMGWSFTWVSSGNSDFNYDFNVSATADELAAGTTQYNYQAAPVRGADMHGTSVFARDAAGDIYHTYSTYGRGMDPLNAAYGFIDLTAKGRDEAELPFSMAWVKRHDEY